MRWISLHVHLLLSVTNHVEKLVCDDSDQFMRVLEFAEQRAKLMKYRTSINYVTFSYVLKIKDILRNAPKPVTDEVLLEVASLAVETLVKEMLNLLTGTAK